MVDLDLVAPRLHAVDEEATERVRDRESIGARELDDRVDEWRAVDAVHRDALQVAHQRRAGGEWARRSWGGRDRGGRRRLRSRRRRGDSGTGGRSLRQSGAGEQERSERGGKGMQAHGKEYTAEAVAGSRSTPRTVDRFESAARRSPGRGGTLRDCPPEHPNPGVQHGWQGQQLPPERSP